MKTITKMIAAALGALVLSTGCFGPMNASANLKTWNREIENRWAGEGVFLVMRYLPVYAVAFVGDVLIFNSFEFWGAENPINPVSPERRMKVAELDANRHG